MRKLLLQKKNLTLQECADMCRASESTNEQMKVMTAKDTVHALQAQAQRKKKKAAESGRQERAKASGKPQECKYCGTSHHKGARYCKAYGKQCQACGKMNHYTRMCKSKPLDKTNSTRKMSRLHTMKHEYDYHSENETYSSDASHNEYALTLTGNEQTVNTLTNQHLNRIYATMEVDGRRTKFQLDTGATCNVLRKSDLGRDKSNLIILTEAKVFSVLDVRNGFWHIELDKESSLLTTFATPFGRYRWKRTPFSISAAPEIPKKTRRCYTKPARSFYYRR